MRENKKYFREKFGEKPWQIKNKEKCNEHLCKKLSDEDQEENIRKKLSYERQEENKKFERIYKEKNVMYSTMKEMAEALWIPFCLSMIGFIVRIVRFGFASWRTFISSLFCSAFAGMLAHWFLAGSGIDTQIASAVIAMSGYCGGALIDAISSRIVREVKDVSSEYIPPLGFPRTDTLTHLHNNVDPTDEE